MRVLFITHTFYPYYKNGGTYNRMLMFVDALRDVEELDMLFYVPSDIDISPKSVQEFWMKNLQFRINFKLPFANSM